MKLLLQLEEALMFGAAIYLSNLLPFPGWYFWIWFLAPDVGFLGYLINTRVGAVTYNLFHHKGIAVILYLTGVYLNHPTLELIGLVLFGHSSFDRMLGYGLKCPDSFQNTHLGFIGKVPSRNGGN